MMTSYEVGRVKERRRALVTGGAVRVGRALALALGRSGMDVAIGYLSSERQARRTVSDIKSSGARAVAIRANLARAGAARALVTRAARELGGLDIVVNNAAVFYRTPFASTTLAQFDHFLNVNLRAAFFCAQAAAHVMRRRGGHVVNIADAGWDATWPGYVPYTLSKAGLVALTKSLAVVLRPQRIAVNCVAPGAVLRPVGFPLARWKAMTRDDAAMVDDVAKAVLFFATCPRSVTGQVLVVSASE